MYEVDPRRHRSEEEAADYCDCACGNHIEKSAAYRCQGDDGCQTYMCEGCKFECTSCGLPVCADCRDQQGWCYICRGETKRPAIAPQDEAEAVMTAAERGCALAEIKAALSGLAS